MGLRPVQPQTQASPSSIIQGEPGPSSCLLPGPTLTSRHCPGPRWGLCVEHDVIVLRRTEGWALASLGASLLDFSASRPFPSCHPVPCLLSWVTGKPARLAAPDLKQLLEPRSRPVPQVEEAVAGVVAMQGLLHPAVRVWTFLAETQMGEGKLETVGVLASQEPLREGCRGGGDETLEGLEQAEGERGQRGALPPTVLFFLWVFLNGLHPSLPHSRWQPHPASPSIPVLWAHILGVKGIVAATAELVAALGAVKVHAASSGQCVRELALGAVCKGQQVRVRGCHCSSGPQEESRWQ